MGNSGFVVGCFLLTSLAAAPALAGEQREFVGSEQCGVCHAEEYRSWKETFHSRIVASKEGGILKEVVVKWQSDGENAGPATANVTGAAATLADVKYVVGSKWKQRFLVRNEVTGGFQFLDKQFNRLTGKWEKYGNRNDWDTNCGTCHTTGYRILAVEEKSGRTLKASWSELSVGCEACHGPGGRHTKSTAAAKRSSSIFNPARADLPSQSRLCGYCHIRAENERFKTAQGHPREDLPAPTVGESFRAGEDWTGWYPEQLSVPGVQPGKPFDAEYAGELKGIFKTDAFAKGNGLFEEAKHHQEYQGFIQSRHFKSGQLSCITCHAPHAVQGRAKSGGGACIRCHDASYTVEKYMPHTGKTADGLFVRSHTFSKNPRPGGKGASDMAPPEYHR